MRAFYWYFNENGQWCNLLFVGLKVLWIRAGIPALNQFTNQKKGSRVWHTSCLLHIVGDNYNRIVFSLKFTTSTSGWQMSCTSRSIFPSTITPSIKSFNRFRVRRKVDLPQPDGPNRAVILLTPNRILNNSFLFV